MDENLKTLIQVAGICGYMYLEVFGILALILAIRCGVTRNPVIIFILCFLATFILPQALMILGVMYISGSLHQKLLEAQARKKA